MAGIIGLRGPDIDKRGALRGYKVEWHHADRPFVRPHTGWPVLYLDEGEPQVERHVFGFSRRFTSFNALFYVAAHSTAAINIGIIQGALPVFVMLGAYIFYRTPVTSSQLLGVTVTMIGVVMVAARGDLARIQDLAFNPGDLLMVAACTLYAAYTIALRERPAASGLAIFSIMAVWLKPP